jgi:site-specific recombinase XerD
MSEPAFLVHSESWLDRVEVGFGKQLLREEFSPATVRNYLLGVKTLFVYLRERGVDDLVLLDRQLLEDWQDELRDRNPPLKAASRRAYATAVKRLIEWAADRDLVDLKLLRAIARVRTHRPSQEEERQPIPAEDLEQLLAYLGPRRRRTTLIDLRDRALFFFMLETGLRVSEALQVTRDKFERGRVRQKGGSWVEYQVGPAVASAILDYVRARTDDLPWLWIAVGNNVLQLRQLADSGVREIWRRLCFELQIQRFTTHQLRHTCGTVMLELGVDHRVIANWLHHADVRTIHRYAHVREQTRQHALEAMEGFIRDGSHIAPEMLARRSPRGGRPRYR